MASAEGQAFQDEYVAVVEEAVGCRGQQWVAEKGFRSWTAQLLARVVEERL